MGRNDASTAQELSASGESIVEENTMLLSPRPQCLYMARQHACPCIPAEKAHENLPSR